MLDFIGVGVGPFNLSLASLLHQKTDLKYLFFEQKAQFEWHAGMQLPNTVLQVPFMADLVSMVDPTSPFSFLNYLKAQQRLYKFYFLEQLHIPRREYNHYCQWVADQIKQIQYLSTVLAIHAKPEGFEVVVEQNGIQNRYSCRNIVLGTGNVPSVPQCLRDIQEKYPEKCIHSASYLNENKASLKGNIVVLGSGQSSAEVFLDLFDRQYDFDQTDQAQFNLHWLTRSNGFFPMEHAPLGLEHFSPDYLAHFYGFDELNKSLQLGKQDLLFKGISANTIRQIYSKLYHRSIAQNTIKTHLHSQSSLIDATYTDDQRIRLTFQHRVSLEQFHLDTDYVVSATGYTTPEFAFLKHIKSLIQTDKQGRWKITQDYRVIHDAVGQIYVQNMEMYSHGVGTPDLGLGAYRAASIVNQLVAYKLYDLGNQPQCFQHFDPLQNIEMVSNTVSTCHRNRTIQKNIVPSREIQANRAQQNSVHVAPFQKSESEPSVEYTQHKKLIKNVEKSL